MKLSPLATCTPAGNIMVRARPQSGPSPLLLRLLGPPRPQPQLVLLDHGVSQSVTHQMLLQAACLLPCQLSAQLLFVTCLRSLRLCSSNQVESRFSWHAGVHQPP